MLTPYPTEASTIHFTYQSKPTEITTATSDATVLEVPDEYEDILECALDIQLAKRGVCIISMQEAMANYGLIWKATHDVDEAQARPAVRWIKGMGAGLRARDPQFGDNP